MTLATTSTGKFLGMFRHKEDAETFALKQKARYFTTVRLSELPDNNPSHWRRNTTMSMLMFGALFPIRNPLVIVLMLGVFAAVLLLAPRPMKAEIPTFCSDPDLPYWRWLAEGCWMRMQKVLI